MVINRLQTLTYSAVKNGIIHDPLSLFVVILNRLSAHMNNAVWDLSKVFAGIETVCTPFITCMYFSNTTAESARIES